MTPQTCLMSFTEHQNATTLELVGEQVWRGALFLADFILHHHDNFGGAHILEVASGVGLTSVVAAMLATKVTVTGRIFIIFLVLLHHWAKSQLIGVRCIGHVVHRHHVLGELHFMIFYISFSRC